MATREQEPEAEGGATPRDESEGASSEERELSESEEGAEESAPIAGTLGAARYVMTGFFLAVIAAAYVLGRSLGALWGKLAEAVWFQKSVAALARVGEEERSEISMLIGAAIALGLGVHFYRRAEVRQWTNEVASEMSKVTWPDKNEVTNSTIIVIVTSAFATLYLALMDRFWGFVTNLVYGS
jgi:preprotein translocase subunit SecE